MKTKRIFRFFGFLVLTVSVFYGQEAQNVMNPDKPLQGRITVEAAEKLVIRPGALGKDAYFAIDQYSLSPLDGSIYLLDAKDFALHVFDAAGKHLRVIRIKKGQGPGEFASGMPLSHRAYPREEGLWVEDYEKIALFDPQGKVIREKTKDRDYYRIQGITSESFLAITDEFRPAPDPIRAAGNTQRFQSENWEGKSPVPFFSSDKTGGWGNGWVRDVKDYRITPLILFDYEVRDKKIVYGVSDDYVLFIKDVSGKALLTIRRNFIPRKISSDMRRTIMASPDLQRLSKITKQNGEDFEKMMDVNQPWDHLNPMINVQFLENGSLCVFVLKDAEGRFEADLFDPRGRWQATLQFPDSMRILTEPRLLGNRLAGLVLDEEAGEHFYVEYALKNVPAGLLK